MDVNGTKSQTFSLVGQMTNAQNDGAKNSIPPFVRVSHARSRPPRSHNLTIGRDPWTGAEDHVLIEAQEKHGRRWNIISGYLSGRPAVHCRNRWLSLLRAGRITDGIQQAAAMVDTTTLLPVARGPKSESLNTPAPSPTPSHCSSALESTVEQSFNGWETMPSPECAEAYPEGFPYYNTRTTNSQDVSPCHNRSGSTSSILSWTDFGLGSLFDQGSYSPEAIGTSIPAASGVGSPSHLESIQAITLTPPSETQSDPLIMTCSLPYCSFQSPNITDIWRHMTWDHIGNKMQCSPEMSALVEKVVIGSGVIRP